MNIIKIVGLLILLNSCRLPDHLGFYQPITLRMTTPDGSPEYKAGWYAGCRSGLGARPFANSWVYEKEAGSADFGSGVYQHDRAFQVGFGQGIWACYSAALEFTIHPAMEHGPLQ